MRIIFPIAQNYYPQSTGSTEKGKGLQTISKLNNATISILGGVLLFGLFFSFSAKALELQVGGVEITSTAILSATSYRFISGAGTSNPTPNTNPDFVGLGYDWSGAGGNGWGSSGRLENIAMISPVNTEGAWHFHFHPGGTAIFFNEITSTAETATWSNDQNANAYGANQGTDAAIGTLIQPFAVSSNIAVYSMLDISSGNYYYQPAFILGTTTVTDNGTQIDSGTQQVATFHMDEAVDGLEIPFAFAGDDYYDSETGDSGSPVFISYKGQLTMAGATWFSNGEASSLLPTQTSGAGYFNYNIGPTNNILAQDGYALRYTIYDMPTDTANTANVWTGGAGTSTFIAQKNWMLKQTAIDLPVVFDSSAAGGQTTVDLGGTQTLRGILFRSETGGSNGFTFTDGTLVMGYGQASDGIQNQDTLTQTFNNSFILNSAQNWVAANGNLVINGNVNNNNYLLVVMGAQNTTINGVVSGEAGLGKDDAGTLTLTASNTYQGSTFLHNGMLMLGTNNALPLATGLRFDANNPAVFDLNGYLETIGDVRSAYGATAGSIAVNGGSLTTGEDNTSSTYSGIFTGGGTVTKAGEGTWTLTGNSSGYTGAMSIAGGDLQLTAGSSVGSGGLNVNQGGALSGNVNMNNSVTLNNGGIIAPGVSGTGALTLGSLLWNSGAISFDLGAPGTSTLLNVTGALTEGNPYGDYQFNFTNIGGLAAGTYNLIDYGSTNFTAANFGYISSNGLVGNFILNAASKTLQFQVTNPGNLPVTSQWTNLTSTPSTTLYGAELAYGNAASWTNGVVGSTFTANVENNFNQAVLFSSSTKLTGPLVINANLSNPYEYGGGYTWCFGASSSGKVLTLGGDVSIVNAYDNPSPVATQGIIQTMGNTVLLLGGDYEPGNAVTGTQLQAIDLGGATRTFTTDIYSDVGGLGYGLWVEAPITDSSNSGAGIIKAGVGNLEFSQPNTFTGPVNIQGGIITLLYNATLASNQINLSGGTELHMDSSQHDYTNGAAIVNNRLTGSNLVIDLNGAAVSFQSAGSGTQTEIQNLGTVNAQSGFSFLYPLASGGGADNALLNVTALNVSAGAVMDFASLAAGTVSKGGGYVTIGTINGSAPVNGQVLPWAYTGVGTSYGAFSYTGFGVYTTANGVQALSGSNDSNYLSFPTLSSTTGLTAASDFKLTAAYAMTGNVELNSLMLNGALTTSLSSPTLKIDSGGLMILSSATIGSAANPIVLNFNGKQAIIGVSAVQYANFYSPITNASGLLINAAPTNAVAVLNFANTYNWGTTYINAGRLAIANASALPTTGDVVINVSSTGPDPAEPGYGVANFPASLDLRGNSITIGALDGAGIVALSSLSTISQYALVTGNVSGTLTMGNGGDTGLFSGSIQNALIPLNPYGAYQGTMYDTYGTYATSGQGDNFTFNISKTGTGTETLSGPNSYTGSTTINGGTLALSGTGTLGINSPVLLTSSGAVLDIGASTITPAVGSLTGSAGTIVNLGSNTLSVGGNDQSSTYSGVLNGSGELAKTGAGTMLVNGSNFAGGFTGAIAVNQGVLKIDHSSNSRSFLTSSAPLILGGGILQSVNGGADTAGGLKVNAGASGVQTSYLTAVALGAITRNAGGTVDFTFVYGGSIATNATNGSLIGWGTVNGMSDWAYVNGGAIVSASSVGGVETLADNASTWSAGGNVINDSSGFSGTTGSNAAVNSILFNGSRASNIAVANGLTVTSGGILETAAVGNNASIITGGNITSGNGQDLVVIQNNTSNTLTIGSAIYGQAGLTKSGAGTLVVSGNNIYYGPTTINQGQLALSGAAMLGSDSTLSVAAGAMANLSGASASQTFGSIAGSGNIIIGAGGMTTGVNGNSSQFGGMITGNGGLTQNGNGTLTLTGLNTYSGSTTIGQGTIAVTGYGTLGYKSAVTIEGINSYTNDVETTVPGILDLSGATSAVTLGSLSGYGNLIVDALGTIIGTDNTSTTFSGNFMGIGSFTKVGTGTLTLTGANYTTADTQYNNVVARGFAVDGGTLLLDFSNDTWGKVPPNTTRIDLGGGTLTALGNAVASGTQSTAIDINSGASYITDITPASSGWGANFTFNLGGFSRSTGGTIDFTAISQGLGVATLNTTTAITNSIIGGYATVNNMSDWATLSSGVIVTATYSSGTQYTSATLDNPANWTVANDSGLAQANITDSVAFSGTMGGSATINSLRINANAAASIGVGAGNTLTIASGGILETGSVGAYSVTISGGTLSTGNGADLIFIQNNTGGIMAVSSAITSNGVTKSGAGELMLTGADTYSGATTVNQGTLALGGSSAAGNGSSAVTVFNGATYDLSASTLTSQAFGSLSSMSADGNTGGGTVILAANSTLTVGSNNNSTTFNGVIKGSGAGLTKAGTGDLSLGGSNTYTGSTLINAGILTLTLGGAIQGSVNVGNGSAIATLEGSGTVGNVTVNSASASDYGILAAGIVIGGPYTIASAGTLTTGNLTLSGANAQVDFLLGNSALAGTTYSTIVVNGNLTLGNALLNLTALPDFSPGTYDLFSYSGTESGTLTLGSLPNGYTASQISISYGGGSVDLVATAKPVPEPATWAALLGGMLMLAGARARRGPRQGIV